MPDSRKKSWPRTGEWTAADAVDDGSVLVRQLGTILDLTHLERIALRALVGFPQLRRKGTMVVVENQPADRLFVVRSGWLAVRVGDEKTGRSILRIHLPGDFVGLSDLGLRNSGNDVVMLTAGAICPIERSDVGTMFEDHPRLAALLMSVASLDGLSMRRHAAALALCDAEARVKLFLLEMRYRLEVAGVGLGNRFPLPISQVEIAETLGLTAVYVNRIVRKLEADGHMEIARPYVRLLRRAEWEAETGCFHSVQSVDTSWFPPSRH